MNVTRSKVIRLLPPLTIDDAQAEEIVSTVSTLIKDHAADGN
jgi:acetylornithine aminotransferase